MELGNTQMFKVESEPEKINLKRKKIPVNSLCLLILPFIQMQNILYLLQNKDG